MPKPRFLPLAFAFSFAAASPSPGDVRVPNSAESKPVAPTSKPLAIEAKKETPVVATTTPPATAEAKPETKPDPLETMRAEVARLNLQRDKIAAELGLKQAELDQKLAPAKLQLLESQSQIEQLKTQLELAEIKRKAAADEELAELRRKSERVAFDAMIAKNESDIEGYEQRHAEATTRAKTSAIALEIELQQKQIESRTWAQKEPTYAAEPFVGNKLTISDRRIPLNGVITGKTADEMADRIAYYNNRDITAPIFIVIDDCPGGSVMAGYKILRTMHGSQAPVYVVVKSFAASMAACITTCAKRSFAYPNAVILHHQLSSLGMGNLTQQKEGVKQLEEWWKRLAEPVAQKMGLSREDFIKRMYVESSTGDWTEFGDNAAKLKWVDVIVDEIVETAQVRHPDAVSPLNPASPQRSSLPGMPTQSELTEGKDDHGRPTAVLPRLNPLDAYWLFNPDGYYRMP